VRSVFGSSGRYIPLLGAIFEAAVSTAAVIGFGSFITLYDAGMILRSHRRRVRFVVSFPLYEDLYDHRRAVGDLSWMFWFISPSGPFSSYITRLYNEGSGLS